MLCVLDATIKDKAFRLVRVYGPSAINELSDFFPRIEWNALSSRLVIFVAD